MTAMAMHFADAWEALADAFPDRWATIHDGRRQTWRQYEDRAARLAAAFTAAGLGPHSKIGLYLYNSPEYMETQFAGMKIRGVPVNVNYRYRDDELAYLLENSDAEAVFFHTSLGDRVARVAPTNPNLKLVVAVDDGGDHVVPGAIAYEDLVAAHDPMPRIERSEDDLYMLYTGGTTGMPKGVMYRIGDFTLGIANNQYALSGLPVPTDPAGLVEAARALEAAIPVSIPACPQMHGTGMWLGSMSPHMAAGCVVTLPARTFDADELLRTVADEAVERVIIVGDAFAKPILRALQAAAERGVPYDLPSLKLMVSSGVMWGAEVKAGILDHIPHLVIVDAVGSTEAGAMGVTVTTKGSSVETAHFARSPEVKVFTEDDREVEPGSGEAGMVATKASSLGYFKDPAKTDKTFRVIDGVRYCFAGDWATVEADGSLTLLGRGSQCINTGGEKVFPEEVEEAVKRTPGVLDCLVVGIPDERFGEAVTAVVSTSGPVSEGEIIASVKGQLSGFKAPKRVLFVSDVPRAPNGKADYKTAKKLALD
ncbi:MAG TPA: AMP-binding protein [Acidimicrobiales bacterium]